MDFCFAFCRLRDAGEDLQQRAFTSSVAANDAGDLALFDLERDVSQGPKGIVTRRSSAISRKHRF